jgi:hypothetical protein
LNLKNITMVYSATIAVAAIALFGALPVNAGLYPKSSAVLQLDGKSYDRLIAQSNYTSVSLILTMSQLTTNNTLTTDR